MNQPKRSILLAALMPFALLAASCGGDDAATTATETPSAATDLPAATAAPAADPAEEQAAEEDAATETETSEGEAEASEAAVDPEPTAESEAADPASSADGMDLTRFFDGALVDEPAAAPCTLASGTETECYEITIVGYPVDTGVGSFCPTTIEATADEVGIWFDGDAVYDIDGEFILDLANIYNDDNWLLYDEDGNVNVTDTPEAFDAAARPDVDPAYQNHCVEGAIEWLEGGEPVTSTVEIPVAPVMAAAPTPLSGSVGITLNGVIIDGQAPVDAILGAYTIAAFDDCGGHINPAAGYHVHGATGCSEHDEVVDGDTAHFAYALDGFPIHSPLTDEQAAVTQLDECNGHTVDGIGYHYHANSAEVNAVLTCLFGETVTAAGDGRPPR